MNIYKHGDFSFPIISYQAITGNNRLMDGTVTLYHTKRDGSMQGIRMEDHANLLF